jgi:hypothetical protein
VAVIIGLIASALVTADLYETVHRAERQSIANGVSANQTLANITTVSTVLNHTASELLGLIQDIRASSINQTAIVK